MCHGCYQGINWNAEATSHKLIKNFCGTINPLYRAKHHWKPPETQERFNKNSGKKNQCSFPGWQFSLDFMHWQWKSCQCLGWSVKGKGKRKQCCFRSFCCAGPLNNMNIFDFLKHLGRKNTRDLVGFWVPGLRPIIFPLLQNYGWSLSLVVHSNQGKWGIPRHTLSTLSNTTRRSPLKIFWWTTRCNI